MPYVDLRLLRQLYQDNPPSVVILFGIVFLAVGYAWSHYGPFGLPVLGFGAALFLVGAAYEVLWLRRRRDEQLEP